MKEVIIGFDPGKNGAIFVINGEFFEYYKSPTIGDAVDVHEFVNIIRGIKNRADKSGNTIKAFVEDVHALHGSAAKSTFNFGGSVWMIHTALIAFKIPFVLVQPKKWQSKCWQGVKIQRKMIKGKMSTDTKSTSLIAAKRLFPDQDFIPDGCRVAHDGVVDAAMVAYYGKNFHFNNV